MGYTKLVKYGNNIDIYEYEKDLPDYRRNGHKRFSPVDVLPSVGADGADIKSENKQVSFRRQDNARRAQLAFSRLVKSNLGCSENPLLASFTYATHITDLGQGRKDFASFGRNFRRVFGVGSRYIAVSEFQRSGRLHFHALLWTVGAEKLAKTERHTRLFAGLWRKGFVDLVYTDGNDKLSSYLAKYMGKAFLDSRLFGQKAYITSKNVLRPITERCPLLAPYFYGGLVDFPDLSTVPTCRDVRYNTYYLGECHFRNFDLKFVSEKQN